MRPFTGYARGLGEIAGYLQGMRIVRVMRFVVVHLQGMFTGCVYRVCGRTWVVALVFCCRSDLQGIFTGYAT
jgi:hypothetical protein